jgi:hypothetical protein
MENPKHGRNHFYSPQEVEQAKLNGWVVVDKSAPAPAEEKPAEPEPAKAKPPAPAAKHHNKK